MVETPLRWTAFVASLLVVACGARDELMIEYEGGRAYAGSDTGGRLASGGSIAATGGRATGGAGFGGTGGDSTGGRATGGAGFGGTGGDSTGGRLATGGTVATGGRTMGPCVSDADCPEVHYCDPADGCQARAYAHTASAIYDIRLPSGRVSLLASMALTDIAKHPNGSLYGISFGFWMTIDPKTWTAPTLNTLQGGANNSFGVAPDGTAYVAGGRELGVLDVGSGSNVVVAQLPSGMSSSGDLDFVEGRLLLTAQAGGSADVLLEYDVINRSFRAVGIVGYRCVYGLAAFGRLLYGLTCDGDVLGIDPDSGRGTHLAKTTLSFWGAASQ